MIEVKETTYEVDGWQEPCWIVSNGYAEVRIARMYHILGADTLYLRETLGGAYNNDDEWDGDFDSIDEEYAIELAKRFSVYLRR